MPRGVLPEVRDSAADFGVTSADVLGHAIPIAGVAGDQQAATVGQACFGPGMMKSTYGTGCFAVMNTGAEAVRSRHRLLTTVAWRLEGAPTYALEGSIFVAGAAVQWLRDGLRIIESAPETEALAGSLPDSGGVYLVPAFTGLGAPHWDPDARGAIYGLTRDTGPAHLARAALESVCLQTRDLIAAMEADQRRRHRPIAGRRRHGRERLAAPGAGGHRRGHGRTAAQRRDHGPGSGVPGGTPGRRCSDRSTKSPRDGGGTRNSRPGCRIGERARLVRGWESAVARTLEHRGPGGSGD